MSERYARKARQDAIQHALDRAAACQTMHRYHPVEGWDCAAAEYAHLAMMLRLAPPRPTEMNHDPGDPYGPEHPQPGPPDLHGPD